MQAWFAMVVGRTKASLKALAWIPKYVPNVTVYVPVCALPAGL